ncbi:MAG: S4 domain-containing protein [Candidatus Pacearchaeota archaeon]
MHIKRMSMPKTWPLQRKDKKFITRGRGAQRQELSLPLVVVLRDVLKIAQTASEVKKLLKDGNVNINGKVVKDVKSNVGIFDRIYISKIDKQFTIHLMENGKLNVTEINKNKGSTKPCRIISKRIINKNQLQLNCSDGRNFLFTKHDESKEYKVGDSILIAIGTNKIIKVLKMEKGAFVLIISGKNIGKHGKIESLEGKMAIIHTKHGKVTAPKDNLFVLEEREFEK